MHNCNWLHRPCAPRYMKKYQLQSGTQLGFCRACGGTLSHYEYEAPDEYLSGSLNTVEYRQNGVPCTPKLPSGRYQVRNLRGAKGFVRRTGASPKSRKRARATRKILKKILNESCLRMGVCLCACVTWVCVCVCAAQCGTVRVWRTFVGIQLRSYFTEWVFTTHVQRNDMSLCVLLGCAACMVWNCVPTAWTKLLEPDTDWPDRPCSCYNKSTNADSWAILGYSLSRLWPPGPNQSLEPERPHSHIMANDSVLTASTLWLLKSNL